MTKKHKSKRRVYLRNYYLKNRKKILKKSRVRSKVKAKQIKEIKHRYYLKNKKRISEEHRKYRNSHKRKIKKRWEKWFTKNKIRSYRRKIKYRKSYHGRFITARLCAKSKGFIWGLKEEQYINLIQNNCVYCNEPLERFGIGLDRLNNEPFYRISNAVPCCRTCNMMKSKYPFAVFLKKISYIINNSVKIKAQIQRYIKK